MTLPTFRSLGARRQARQNEKAVVESNGAPNADTRTSDINSDRTLTPGTTDPAVTGVDLKKATKTRKHAIMVASFLYFISVIFLILTIIGNISNRAVLRNTYFFKLNLTNIIPVSAGNSLILVNSLARSLGLHDFYQVGLWNFCEGYNDEGITDCSSAKAFYWFNPVDIFVNELLPGATIALPAEINNILSLLRIASHIMFGFFLTGVCMNFVNIFLSPIVLYSRWISFPFAIWTFISALLTVAATIIATVIAVVLKNVVTSQANLNIGASIGTEMFAFMWIGAGGSLIGWLIHLCLSCCCASRRDVKTGRKRGNKEAYASGVGVEQAGKKGEKGAGAARYKLPVFRRRRTGGEVV
ncbi:integral membrane protein [Rutstroemia sp. NJR-2017a BBW]|nr:integral membrane protein [Rutstroemia sp. NJR-2017a BBW]